MEELGGNAPCPCGSGMKYKKCCLPRGVKWERNDEGVPVRRIPLPVDLVDALAAASEGKGQVPLRQFPPEGRVARTEGLLIMLATNDKCTLAMRLVGAQSWSTGTNGRVMAAGREPSKSGLIGMIGSAMGVPRDDVSTIARLAACRMGVRIDVAPTDGCDFATAGAGEFCKGTIFRYVQRKLEVGRYGCTRADGTVKEENAMIWKWFMQDAFFVVALEGDRAILEEAASGLRRPVFGLSLGRRCFKPTMPVLIGIKDGLLEPALEAHPWTPDEIPLPDGVKRSHWIERQYEHAKYGVPALIEVGGPVLGAKIVFDVPVNFVQGPDKPVSQLGRYVARMKLRPPFLVERKES